MENEQDDYSNGNDQALATQDQHQQRSNSMRRQDFSGMSLAVGNAATEALVAKARADTEARWIMAMRRPRNLDDVRQMLLKECRRPGFADVAIYSVPRGDTRIEGLSIRFAEVAARCMGNMQPEVVTIYDDETTRIVRVTVTDYESNVTWSKDLSIKKTVERKFLKKGQRSHGERENSYGQRVYIVDATDDDVNTKEAALVSKAVRTLILRIIPGHLQDEAFAICAKISQDKDAKDPDAARIAMLDSFASIGVKPSEIEEYLGHTTERMAPVEVDGLRRLFAAIRDGEVTWAEALSEAIGKRVAGAKPAAPTSSPAAAQAAPTPAPAAQGPAAPAQPQGTPAPAKATTTSKGKATAALKAQIAEKPPGPPTQFDKAAEAARERDAARAAAAPAAGPGFVAPGWTGEPEPAEPEPEFIDGIPLAELRPDIPEGEARAVPPDQDRACAKCNAWIQVPKVTPPGARCYSCAQT